MGLLVKTDQNFSLNSSNPYTFTYSYETWVTSDGTSLLSITDYTCILRNSSLTTLPSNVTIDPAFLAPVTVADLTPHTSSFAKQL